MVFKDRDRSFRRSKNKKEEEVSGSKSPLTQFNLAEIKPSHRYREGEKEGRADSFRIYGSNDHEKGRHRLSREPVVLTSRNREEMSTERGEMFKIRRKSISGNLNKKIKEHNAQYLSANPVLPVELNYFDEARKLYKEGKTS
jgi:hypothetical protein